MLSEEEKEALDKLSSKKNESTWNDTIRQIKREEIKDVVVTRQKYITAVLNLIEKQSKEIEENKKYLVNLTHEQYIKLVEQIRSEINKEWKDVIKAKIEELERGNKNTFIRGEKILVLQSLLEKE